MFPFALLQTVNAITQCVANQCQNDPQGSTAQNQWASTCASWNNGATNVPVPASGSSSGSFPGSDGSDGSGSIPVNDGPGNDSGNVNSGSAIASNDGDDGESFTAIYSYDETIQWQAFGYPDPASFDWPYDPYYPYGPYYVYGPAWCGPEGWGGRPHELHLRVPPFGARWRAPRPVVEAFPALYSYDETIQWELLGYPNPLWFDWPFDPYDPYGPYFVYGPDWHGPEG